MVWQTISLELMDFVYQVQIDPPTHIHDWGVERRCKRLLVALLQATKTSWNCNSVCNHSLQARADDRSKYRALSHDLWWKNSSEKNSVKHKWLSSETNINQGVSTE